MMFEHATEADFQTLVVDYARLQGWLVHHTRPARTGKGWRTPIQGDVGFPDLVLARAGRVVFAELKSEKGRLSAGQSAWLKAVDGLVWRPSDWQTIKEILR